MRSRGFFDLVCLPKEQQVSHKIFWVVEPTSNGYQSHSHFLIQGETAKDHVFEFYRSKNLINLAHVVNDPYQVRKGAFTAILNECFRKT